MKKKRKTLPKNFKELIEAGNMEALKKVFDECELNATGGYGKGTALYFFNVPDELIRWMAAEGADINFKNIYGYTPLHEYAMRRSGKVDILLELGADISAVDKDGDTPLHMAAGSSFNIDMLIALMKKGADALAKNNCGETPLAYALSRAGNIDIENLAVIAEILLKAGDTVTENMRKAVSRIGENFEFHRENFNEESLPATDAALSKLYQIFDVNPVKKRIMHDGKSPITVSADKWEDQYAELWDLLVPSSGPTKTVQGEVIRITGKVRGEIYRNGGANWDKDYKKMLDALLVYLASGAPLDKKLLEEASAIAKEIRQTGDGDEELSRLCELALKWVIANPNPVLLGKPDYDR